MAECGKEAVPELMCWAVLSGRLLGEDYVR